MVRSQLPAGLLALIGAFLCGAATAAASSSAPAPSPAADVDLICHTDNPAECYPKLFHATDEFQKVHPDQDLPMGLHVRLNIYTGEKEAKINVPDEINPDLDGLPVDSSLITVDAAAASEGGDAAAAQPGIPPNAPVYDPAGQIKEPRAARSAEGSTFHQSLSILKKGLDVDAALEMLEDISHDIYYGLKIAEDYETVKQLLCLASSDGPSLRRARLAAQTISSTAQNNPKALDEIEKHWPALQNERCEGSTETLDMATFRLVSPATDPTLAKARVSAIGGLLKNAAIRRHYLANGGIDLLLEVLATRSTAEAPEWEPAQRRAGLLVLDTFLDEDMGAVLGEWPTGGQADDKTCAARADVSGQCWDWHAKKLAERNKADKGHWSVELWAKLREQRKANRGKAAGAREAKGEL
ncbi:hypothetical protein B0T22DRAFT_476738 [Podospora appendiculata]|uniref:Nucleotide exchange factor SIL1 n=1 Tax=Podospora appendiculata TaxID=314037 RepID=A0AAE1CGY7_9PEZI|nr:hypothetical protein B0T22DRAFT_476738 [Podospora appendiculata]